MDVAIASTNKFSTDQACLREHLTLFLQEQGFPPTTASGADIRLVLATPRKLLSLESSILSQNQIPAGIWALLLLHIARYCAPDANPDLLNHIALAAECFMCALDLLDDVEDDDHNPLRETLGDARVLNVATILLALTSQCLLTCTRYGLSLEQVHILLNTFYQQWLNATQGQHHDLLAEHEQDTSEEDCLRIIEAKSGSLVRLVCLLATLSVDASQAISDLFAQAGTLIGIAYQLDNDILDLSNLLHPSPDTCYLYRKTDLVRGKKTLPIVLANQRYVYNTQNIPFSNDVKEHTQQEQIQYTKACHEAIKASLAVALYYRSRARAITRQIEVHYGMPFPPSLRFLLGLETLP